VAAGVRHAHLATEVDGLLGGAEGEVRRLGDRERVHVRSYCHDGPRKLAAKQADDAGVRNAGANLEAQLSQVAGDQLGGLDLAVPELGVPVNGVPVLDHLGRYAIGGRCNGRFGLPEQLGECEES
jgi:hypothetical protein